MLKGGFALFSATPLYLVCVCVIRKKGGYYLCDLRVCVCVCN